ncbi:chorismate mutase [Microbacterium sp. NPDC087665]|uniref:chorismate mutase n=1 Tax=Microbacterium sp. NPDC087665 TaxID=3364194 RepID=UPI0037F517F6
MSEQPATSPGASPTLDDLRERIDSVDRRMVELIAERQDLVIAAGALKRDEDAVRAPVRVEQVIAKVRSLAQDAGASPDVVERTYRALIAAFIDLELERHRAG